MSHNHHRVMHAYMIGFVLSLIITLASYMVATSLQTIATPYIIALLIGLATMQIVVQVMYFLHLGNEVKPRWNTIAFITMAMVVAFIVVGSIWIMNNLNYNMMHSNMEATIRNDEGMSH